MRRANAAGYVCALRKPPFISLEFEAELAVVDAEITILAALDRIRPHQLYLLRHHADVGMVAADITEAIIAEAVVEVPRAIPITIIEPVSSNGHAEHVSRNGQAEPSRNGHEVGNGRFEEHGSSVKVKATGEQAAIGDQQ